MNLEARSSLVLRFAGVLYANGQATGQIAAVARRLGRTLGLRTELMARWGELRLQSADGDRQFSSAAAVDPDGVIDANIERDRIVGCIVYPAGELIAPGVIHVVEGNRFSVGELDGSDSERIVALSEMLVRAGFKSYVLHDIRSEVWLKLWGNLSFNPISALTRATLAAICRDPGTRALAADMMREAQQIAEKLGITFRHTIEKRIAGAEAVGEHKTSMLQDVEAGRTLEIEALVGAVVELGRLTETPTPHIDSIYAAVTLLNENLSRPTVLATH